MDVGCGMWDVEVLTGLFVCDGLSDVLSKDLPLADTHTRNSPFSLIFPKKRRNPKLRTSHPLPTAEKITDSSFLAKYRCQCTNSPVSPDLASMPPIPHRRREAAQHVQFTDGGKSGVYASGAFMV